VGYIKGSIEVEKDKHHILHQLKNIKQTLQDENNQVLQGYFLLFQIMKKQTSFF
jgi:hypothetical protein